MASVSQARTAYGLCVVGAGLLLLGVMAGSGLLLIGLCGWAESRMD